MHGERPDAVLVDVLDELDELLLRVVLLGEVVDRLAGRGRDHEVVGLHPAAQVDDMLQKNWTQARALGMNPPNISVDQFVRQTQSKVGEPKPGVARVLSAVQKLSKKDVLITPNLAADEIIETDELR